MTRAKTPERPTPSAPPAAAPPSSEDTPAAGPGRRLTPRRLLSGRLVRFFIIVALGAGAVTLVDDPFSVNSGVEAGVPAGTALTSSGSLVVREDGAVIEGLHVEGRIWIRADDVTIRNTRVSYRGYHSIRVMPGFTGTTVEHVDIECGSAKTNGVVFGSYTATAVATSGCRNGFVTTGGNVNISDSLVDGEPFEESLGARPDRPATTTTVPPTTAPPTTAPATTTTTAPAEPEAPASPPVDAPAPNPPSGDFPNESTTGYRGSLTPSGSITVTEEGRVLENLHITGTVTIEADNVTIRNSLIDNTGTYPIRTTNGNTNLLVEDTEIRGNGQGNVAVYGGSYTLRRLNIHGTLDGPRIEGNDVVIEDSYIHHLHRIPGGHHDTIQLRRGVGVRISGNNLQAYNPDTNDPMNAALQIGSLNGPTGDVLVENNLMNGGNYTVNAGKAGGNSFLFRNNVFGDDARYGIYSDGPGVVWEASNIAQATGQAIS